MKRGGIQIPVAILFFLGFILSMSHYHSRYDTFVRQSDFDEFSGFYQMSPERTNRIFIPNESGGEASTRHERMGRYRNGLEGESNL